MLVAMWNYMGWDNAATVANEVENPQKTYPRVMMLALAAIFLSYVIPVPRCGGRIFRKTSGAMVAGPALQGWLWDRGWEWYW